MADLKRSEQQTLAKVWQQLIRAGIKHRSPFKDGYEISKKFAYGSHEFMYEETMPDAPYKATVPKVWEMINVFGPMLAFRNPHRNVRIRYEKPDDERTPLARVMKDLLNYSINELHLVREMRECVDESFVGCGAMWLERDKTTNLYGHFHDSALNLVIDPDAETLKDAWWIARKRMMPRWEFASRVGVAIDHEDLPSSAVPSLTDAAGYESVKRQHDDNDSELYPTGKTHELLPVYEVFSKMGVGWKARGVAPEMFERAKTEESKPENLYRHFYVLLTSDRLWKVDDWPVPLWMDNDWPVELLYFRKDRKYCWPIPLLKPALGLQKAINWVAMFMWQHLRTSSRDFIAGSNELDETIRDRIISGQDLEFLPINTAELGDKKWQDLIGFLQHPPVNADLWRYMELAQRLFEESTGLLPALYAQSGQAEPRSATAAQNREARADLRPDDMREVVEQMHTRMARKEAIAARLDYGPDFVGEILGQEAAAVWEFFMPKEDFEEELARVMREFDYRIEVGSAAKPNLRTEQDNSLEVFDRLAQVAVQIGDIPNLNKMAYNLQRSYNINEKDMVQFQPPPPPEQQQDPAQDEKVRGEKSKADLEQIKALIEEAKLQQEVAKTEPQGAPPSGEVMAVEGGNPIFAP